MMLFYAPLLPRIRFHPQNTLRSVFTSSAAFQFLCLFSGVVGRFEIGAQSDFSHGKLISPHFTQILLTQKI